MAQLVLRQGVCTALDDDGIRAIGSDASIHDFLKDVQVDLIADSLLKWDIDCEVFAYPLSSGIQGASAWEKVLFKLMEAHRHHSIRVVECLFNAVSVMNIYVQVEDPWIDLQQLKNADYNVIDVAEPARLGFASMMITTTPVDDHIGHSRNDEVGSVQTPTGSKLAEIVQPLEARAIEGLVYFILCFKLGVISCLLSLFLFVDIDNIVLFGSNPLLQVADVAGVMERCHFLAGGLLAHEHVQVGAHAVRLNQAMRHLDPLRLHGVLLAEVVVGYGIIVHVGNFLHARTQIVIKLLQKSGRVAITSFPIIKARHQSFDFCLLGPLLFWLPVPLLDWVGLSSRPSSISIRSTDCFFFTVLGGVGQRAERRDAQPMLREGETWYLPSVCVDLASVEMGALPMDKIIAIELIQEKQASRSLTEMGLVGSLEVSGTFRNQKVT